MKTESKGMEKCQVELTVTLDAEEAQKIIKDVEKAFVREVQIPGFRRGKVPLALVRKEFADGIENEVKRTVFQRNIAEAVKAEKIEEVAIADVRDITCTSEGGGFTAVIEVKPTFDLPKYKGLKIASNDVKVTDEMLNERIEAIRAAYAKFEDAKEGEAASDGDFVQIDYSGTIDGKSILEIAPDAKIVAQGTGFWFQMEEGRFLPEIIDAVKGMKIGETKEGVNAKFHPEAAPEPLKGKEAVYTVTLKGLRRRILPTDAELIERAKVESMDKMRETTREAMQKRADEDEKTRRENEAVEQILKGADFAVPGSQVSRTADGILQQLAERAQYSGLNAEYFEKNREKIYADAQENAARQVRLWYIIDAIAKAEGIAEDDKDKGRKVIDLIIASSEK
ncbi:MAG: trigger factor [Lentisphaerae bacterium]|jgi:trigger factor|nr:trigger factor [Lentisphaerota bacterium]